MFSPGSPNTHLSSQPPPDIEDICHICESVSVEPAVTVFPMRVDRKKVREELDIVNVIEWRQDLNSGERFFLLIRRPKIGIPVTVEFICRPHFTLGLLAGLHDFATLANMSQRLAAESTESLSLKSLGAMFGCVFREDATVNSDKNAQTIAVAQVSIIGDVFHVFSHIRKTYRVVWILMTGSDRPPMLRKAEAAGFSEKPVHRSRRFDNRAESQENSDLHMEYSWMLFGQVAGAT